MKAFPRDIEIETLKERHIGVESELGVKGCERYSENLPDDLESKLSEKGLLQNIGHDGGGREFRTNPISVKSLLKQVRGRKYFEGYYMELKHHTTVLGSGGTHVHISILDSDHENMEANAVALATAFYQQFQKIAGRKSSWAFKMEVKTFEQVKEQLGRSRRSNRVYEMKGSILGPTYHKTLEFRGPKGSNNSEEILAWIDFLNGVVKVANRKSVNGVKFADLIKGSCISEYVKTLTGTRKFTKHELNKTLNTAKLA